MVLLLFCVNVLNDVLPMEKVPLNDYVIPFRLPEELTKGYTIPKLITDYGMFYKEDIVSFLKVEDNLPVVSGKSIGQVLTLRSGEHDVDIKDEVERCYLEAIIFKNTLPFIQELQELSKNTVDKTDIESHKELERRKFEGKTKIMMKRNEELTRIKSEAKERKEKRIKEEGR